jgi:aldehyde:ferredoxin oxidoreductase
LFFPAALAAVAAALLIGSSGPAAHRCAATVRAPATELIVKARQCRLTLPRTPVPFFAH